MPSKFATELALKMQEKWTIGESSMFCDEHDFDHATTEEIATMIDEAILSNFGEVEAHVAQ